MPDIKGMLRSTADYLLPHRNGGPLDLVAAERAREERAAAARARERAEGERERVEDEAALSYIRDRLATMREERR